MAWPPVARYYGDQFFDLVEGLAANVPYMVRISGRRPIATPVRGEMNTDRTYGLSVSGSSIFRDPLTGVRHPHRAPAALRPGKRQRSPTRNP